MCSGIEAPRSICCLATTAAATWAAGEGAANAPGSLDTEAAGSRGLGGHDCCCCRCECAGCCGCAGRTLSPRGRGGRPAAADSSAATVAPSAAAGDAGASTCVAAMLPSGSASRLLCAGCADRLASWVGGPAGGAPGASSSRSATWAAVGRRAGSGLMHCATRAATWAGQSSGTRRSRMRPRTGTSPPLQISHSTTPAVRQAKGGGGGGGGGAARQ